MKNTNVQDGWFSTWFDTEYYHVLYANRDETEAADFINALVNFLQPNKENSHLLDLACGKGRHSIHLNNLGFRVTGIDLSENSIKDAKKFENDRLKFCIQDMRVPIDKQFTHVFNLFTSFGYFDNIEDNHKVIDAIDAMTESGAYLVFDFLNAQKVVANLVKQETKTSQGLTFNITRKSDDNHVYKYIDVEDQGEVFHFMERVQLLDLEDFKALLEPKGFKIEHTFGEFNLSPFDAQKSNRLIVIARKS